MNKENEQYEYGYIDGNTIIEKNKALEAILCHIESQKNYF